MATFSKFHVLTSPPSFPPDLVRCRCLGALAPPRYVVGSPPPAGGSRRPPLSRLSFAVDDRGQDVDGVVDQRHGSHARTSPIVVKNLVRRVGARHGV